MALVISKKAAKHYKHLPKSEQAKIKKHLLALQENPLAGKKLERELHDYRSLRAWPYRIIYQINEKELIIEVSDILHRQGAYKP